MMLAKKVLITGGSGMVGQNISFGIKPTSTELDITSQDSINKYVDLIGPPDIIIHLVALNIRDCEKSPSAAIKININGTLNMLQVAKKYDIPFVFFSSGAVFSSPLHSAIFTEEISPDPKCLYGDTKKTAEDIVKMYNKAILIRTGWLFGGIQKTHNKFVELVINSLLLNTPVKGSNDFYGSPTYTQDVINKMIFLIDNNKYGVHHVINSGYATGYEIAIEIANILDKPIKLIKSVSASNVPNSSPNRSASECLCTLFDYNIMRPWKEALKEYIVKYLELTKTPYTIPHHTPVLWTARQTCRLCNNPNLHTFFKLEDTPPANHIVSQIQYQPKIPLTVAKCTACNHIQLLEIINPSYLYSNYLYISSISKTMTDHLKLSVTNFTTKFNISKDDNILEIGSNDGTCINTLLELGFHNSIGVDPAQNINRMHKLPILCDFFGSNIMGHEQIIGKKFKLIFGFHCCAHIENIQDVFQTAHALLEDDGIFVIEVGYFLDVFNQNNFDVIYHEHIDYHTCYAMKQFAKLNNMTLFDISRNNIQSGSIQFYMCKNTFIHEPNPKVEELITTEISSNIFNIINLDKWRINIIKLSNEFNHLITGLVQQGKKIAGYGASAKSTTFLHQSRMNSTLIKYIIDDNNLKQDKYTPGLHIPIHSREHLQLEPVDYIVILSWNFSDEIIELLKSRLSNSIRIIIPFPNFRIV
jgi:dTDP-4-dehydrorhamnose reductase/SAM-dependent methyltransferase